MKRVLAVFILTLTAAVAFAQLKEFCLNEAPQLRGANNVVKNLALPARSSRSSISTMFAYGSYRLESIDRYGPLFLFQYSPNRFSMPTIDLYAGLMFNYGKSGFVDQREYVPVASRFASRFSPYSNYYYNDYYYQGPQLSFGLGILGTDVTFYFAEGDVKPYAGFGAMFVAWPNASKLQATLAPSAKAGLDIKINTSFSGFAEVRHAVGVPTLIGSNAPRFNGLTAGSIGFSFAPRLR